MIRKSGYGFSEKVMFSQEPAAGAGGSVAVGDAARPFEAHTRAAGTSDLIVLSAAARGMASHVAQVARRVLMDSDGSTMRSKRSFRHRDTMNVG